MPEQASIFANEKRLLNRLPYPLLLFVILVVESLSFLPVTILDPVIELFEIKPFTQILNKIIQTINGDKK